SVSLPIIVPLRVVLLLLPYPHPTHSVSLSLSLPSVSLSLTHTRLGNRHIYAPRYGGNVVKFREPTVVDISLNEKTRARRQVQFWRKFRIAHPKIVDFFRDGSSPDPLMSP
ncbi:unnamed protein product, partial [Ectocarpus sp. 12 AP-2014]